MPGESNLNLTYFDYFGETGVFAGFGAGEENGDTIWTTLQRNRVTRAVGTGQRQFYYPPILDGEVAPHSWSFLKPVSTLTLGSGESEVDLPSDFGVFCGPITAVTGSSNNSRTYEMVGEAEVRRAQNSMPDATGFPKLFALVPLKGVDADSASRYKLTVWPTTDAAYVLSFPYTILPDALSVARPYSYGGMQHAETILASCKYAWERDMDNITGGPQYQNFMERLAASVAMDRRHQPQSLGKNRDASVGADGLRQISRHQSGNPTVSWVSL